MAFQKGPYRARRDEGRGEWVLKKSVVETAMWPLRRVLSVCCDASLWKYHGGSARSSICRPILLCSSCTSPSISDVNIKSVILCHPVVVPVF